MTVKNIILAVTLVAGSTSLALAQTNTRIGPAGVHRTANVGLAQRPLAGAGIHRRMYRRANGPLISAPVGLYGGAAAYQGYEASQGYPGVSYQDNPFAEPETPVSNGF